MAGILVACGPGFSEADPTSAIFDGAPWPAEERIFYEVKQRDFLRGRCEFRTNVDAAAGTTQLSQFCVDAEEGLYNDDRIVTVNSTTLKPIRSERFVIDNKDDQIETKSVIYPLDGSLAQFLSVSGDNEFGADRDLPAPSLDVPQPAWYDDDSLMWLVRGIDFSESTALRFTDVSQSTVTVFNAEFIVEGQTDIEVPAGTFKTWNIKLTTRTVTHRIWVDVAAPHRVVKAQVENVTFELVRAE